MRRGTGRGQGRDLRQAFDAALGMLALAACAVAATRARADDSGDKAAAQALFDEGRRLMAEQSFAAACPKLEASQRLDPGVGTMLNLADCYEKSGKTASAWALFQEAVSEARKAGSIEREEIARSRAHDLEPKLSYLTVVSWRGQEVIVTRNGSPVDAAMFGTAIPVDPGEHVIAANAPGKRSWTTTVEVESGARVSVSVPILPLDAGGDTGPEGQASVPSSGGELGAGGPRDEGGGAGTTQRVLAGVVAGVGVVGVVVGTVSGLAAMSDWDDAKKNCDPYPHCGERGARLADDAQSAATLSTVAFVVGAAGLAGGLVLWLTAPEAGDDRAGPELGFGPGRVLVRGRF